MSFIPVERTFFLGSTVDLARRLLGNYLVFEHGCVLAGRIVEVEAYLGATDPAAHTFGGPTNRTRAMFGEPGHAYIYLSYGNHYCLNVTAQPVGVGEGVLIRAIEPIAGIEQMRRNRGGRYDGPMLTNGPGKLVQAMGISPDFYGHDLSMRPLYIGQAESAEVIEVGPRIGISKAADLPLRFWLPENRYVSRIVRT